MLTCREAEGNPLPGSPGEHRARQPAASGSACLPLRAWGLLPPSPVGPLLTATKATPVSWQQLGLLAPIQATASLPQERGPRWSSWVRPAWGRSNRLFSVQHPHRGILEQNQLSESPFHNLSSTFSPHPVLYPVLRVCTRVFTTVHATKARAEGTQTPTNRRTETPSRVPPCWRALLSTEQSDTLDTTLKTQRS